MILKSIYQGEDYLLKFGRSVNGSAIALSEFSEVEVHLFINDEPVIKFSKTDKVSTGFVRLSEVPGEPTMLLLKAPAANTIKWRADAVVVAQFYFTLISGDKRLFKKELGKVIKMNPV